MKDTAPRFGTPATATAAGTPAAPTAAGTPVTTTAVRVLLVVVALFGALLAGIGPAAAHAALTDSNPKDGAVLTAAPKDITLNFSEQIALGEDAIRVLDPSGKRADTGEVLDLCSADVVKYGVALHSGLPDGTYTIAWQAVSADSHPISGALTFSIGAPSESRAALPSQEAGGGIVGALYGIARYAAYAGFIVLVGGAAFVLVCWRQGAAQRPLQRLVVRGWLLLAAATLAMLLLRAPYTGSGELSGIFDLTALKAVLSTKTGAALVSRLLLLGAAALFVAVLFGAYAKKVGADGEDDGDDEDSSRKDLTFGLALGGGVVAAGIAATWAMSEHASTGIQAGVAMPVDVLHMLAVAAWLGGLAALLVALYRVPALERTAVRNFSRLAFGSVAVLVATGIYQSWRQVGSWQALFETTYGQLLLAKIALVVVMVAAAFFSRRWTGLMAEGATPVAEPVSASASPSASASTSASTSVPEAREAGRKARESREAARDERAAREAATDERADQEAATDERADQEAATDERADQEAATDERADQGAEPEAVAVPADPKRAAQLARQQAAMSTVRAKRVRDADPERAALRRSVLLEAGVAVVLLAVTTVLTSTEPGRTELKEAGRGNSAAPAVADRPVDLNMAFDTGGENGKGTIRLQVTPGRSGGNALHVWAESPARKPVDAPELKVAFTNEAQQIGPLPVVPDKLAPGHWSANGVQIPMAGTWKIEVMIRTSDIDQVTVNQNVKIG